MDHDKRRKRKQDVAERAAKGGSMYTHCRIVGCGRRTTAAEGKGLDRMYCRPHAEHYERHGSYYKGSYTATQLEPHRKAARAWLRAHMRDEVVRRAIRAVEGLYQRAGPHVEAFNLRGLPPRDRARAAWARLRKAGVDPMRPLEAWLAIDRAFAFDPQREARIEFKRVQAAKVIHRMASGSHRRWERQRPSGQVIIQELHRYPPSRGLVLRYIGEQLERAAELVADQYTPPTPPAQRPSDATPAARSASTTQSAPKVTEVTMTRADGHVVRATRTDN